MTTQVGASLPTFQLILLDGRRKFLSSQKCIGIEAVCTHLRRLLTRDTIVTVSIRRLPIKKSLLADK